MIHARENNIFYSLEPRKNWYVINRDVNKSEPVGLIKAPTSSPFPGLDLTTETTRQAPEIGGSDLYLNPVDFLQCKMSILSPPFFN